MIGDKTNFKPFLQRGRWWEPISIADSKKNLQSMIDSLKGAEYCTRKTTGTRIQVAIPKEIWDNREKVVLSKYKHLIDKYRRR